MPSISSNKKAPSKTEAKTKALALAMLITLAFAAYLGTVWTYGIRIYNQQDDQHGRLVVGQTIDYRQLHKSLDLKLAAEASYPSAAISEYKDLGIGATGVKQSIVSFKVTDDKLTEYGLMYRPATDAPPGGYPVIILCHGYYDPTQYQTDYGYLDDMQFYAEHGYAVIKPDYRGQGFSLNQGHPEGSYFSMVYNTDVMSLISAVKKTPSLDSQKINLWGHSMGSYIALRAAILSPDIKSVILLGSPITTPLNMYQNFAPISDRDNPVAQRIKQSALIKYGTPVTNPKFWETASLLTYLDKVSSRVQIHVGSSDSIVPPTLSADLNAAFNKTTVTHQYFDYEGASHGLVDQRDQIWPRSLSYLEQE